MSKLTVTIPDDLHQQIRDELERQGMRHAGGIAPCAGADL